MRNRGNLNIFARQCNISDAFALLIQEIYYRLKACSSMCTYFQKHDQYYKRKHLYSRLEAAKEKDDKRGALQILAIIQLKKDRRFWRQMSYALGKPKGGAWFWVQVEQRDGTTTEYPGQEELHEAIWDNIHWRRFYLQPLWGFFGFNAICQTSQKILDETYKYPWDSNEATKEILHECVLICLQVLESLVDTLITKEVWGNNWGKAKEETSFSVFGRHFSHYKAGLCSAYISPISKPFSPLSSLNRASYLTIGHRVSP